jgi:O-antigen/teichoic acid export membrane protein
VLRASLAVALPILVFGLAMVFGGGLLVTMLYGHRYAGNGLVVTILAFNLAISAVAFSFSRALYTVERPDVEFVVNLVGLFMMLTAGLWLVRSFGILGAALGLLVTNTTASGLRVGAFLRLPARVSGGQNTSWE